MALIVEYHVNADMYAVGTGAITAGMLLALDANSLAVACPTGQAVGSLIGVAGDSALAAEEATTAYSAQVVIGADGGGTRWTENRVSDFYDEATASQKMTVYNGGGKFWISSNLFDSTNAVPPAASVLFQRCNTTAGEWEGGATAGQEVAVGVGATQAYPSGVPGTDIDGSITLGNFFPVVLRI
jgi:hypothetical protein